MFHLSRLILFLILVSTGTLFAQGILKEGRQHVDTLAAPYFHGRGYVNNGLNKASEYIRQEFKNYGLKSLPSGYFQSFPFSINTFPGKMLVKIDGKTLSPGIDYLIELYSKGVKGQFELLRTDADLFLNQNRIKKLLKKDLNKTFLVVDISAMDEKQKHAFQEQLFIFKEVAAGIVLLTDKKLTWGSTNYFTTLTILEIKKESFPAEARIIETDIENKLDDQFYLRNILAYREPLTGNSDSCIVITAHYDHLGQMGADTYFPGANDNASGTALMLSLAKHASELNPGYKIIFIAFSGEEMGLIGSNYFCEHPLIDLKKIKLLVNLDLMGTGEEGITVVNAVQQKRALELLQKINQEKQLLAAVKSRANAANSDHYPFTQKQVPAIFIYAMGGIQAYHDVLDKRETLPLTKYEELYSLLVSFIAAY